MAAINSAWLPPRQPDQLPRRADREQAQTQVVPGLLDQLFQQGQPSADPTLVTSQQLGHLQLTQPVLADQGMHDPRLFQFARSPPDLIQPVNGRLRRRFVGVDPPGEERRHAFDPPACPKSFETVNQHGRFLTPTDHDRRELAVVAK
jgi:hypothetical protein